MSRDCNVNCFDPKKYLMCNFKKEDLKIDKNLFGNGVYIANINSDRQVVICGFKDIVNQNLKNKTL